MNVSRRLKTKWARAVPVVLLGYVLLAGVMIAGGCPPLLALLLIPTVALLMVGMVRAIVWIEEGQ